jgi:hypothetical protein
LLLGAGIFPSVEQFDLFAAHLDNMNAIKTTTEHLNQDDGDDDDEDDKDAGDLQEDDEMADKEDDILALWAHDDGTQKRKKDKKKKQKKKEKEEAARKKAQDTKVKVGGFVMPTSSSVRLSQMLATYVQLARVDGRFHLCNHSDMVVVSNWLQSIPLSIADRYVHSTPCSRLLYLFILFFH